MPPINGIEILLHSHGDTEFVSIHSPDFEQCETVWPQATVKGA
jgi:hypothetical protein